MPVRLIVRRAIVVLLGVTAFSMALTWIYLGMQPIMEMGGACGSGGRYSAAARCPDGVVGLVLGGFALGIAMMMLLALKEFPFGFRAGMLLWPALMLVPAANFFVYGLNPPWGGVSWSWLLCGTLSALMAAPFLVLFRRPGRLRRTFWADGRPIDLAPKPKILDYPGDADAGRTHGSGGSGKVGRSDQGGQPDTLADALERMSALRASGAITEDEFVAAKRRLLTTEEGASP